MQRGASGQWVVTSVVAGESVEAFVPENLPPRRPPLEIGTDLRDALDDALLALGRLDSISSLLPETSLFLYTYVRREAVLSSQIEGTQSTLSDLLLFESEAAPGAPLDDVREVSRYVQALERGLQRLGEGLPLCSRLLREVHGVLLSEGRGSRLAPGTFRLTQNWIGGTRPGNARFVPPPPEEVESLMAALERFLNDVPERTAPLVKAALAHVQFETIHPFLDGNGRIGRLLITLLLCAEGVLQDPLLYLSLYLKENREEYYDLLTRVRLHGDWEGWLLFVATGVSATATQAVTTAKRLTDLLVADGQRIQDLGASAGSALRVHSALGARPIRTVADLVADTGLSAPTVTSALKRMAALQPPIVREITGRRRGRAYAYDAFLEILETGLA